MNYLTETYNFLTQLQFQPQPPHLGHNVAPKKALRIELQIPHNFRKYYGILFCSKQWESAFLLSALPDPLVPKANKEGKVFQVKMPNK